MPDQPAFFLPGARRLHETTLEEIDACEKRLHLVFPTFLKNFYRFYDTMPVRECNFALGDRTFCLTALVTVADGGLSLDSLYECDYFQNDVPEGWIPIGLDLSGDYYFYEPITKMVLLVDQYTDEAVIAGLDLAHFFTLLDNSSPDPLDDEDEPKEDASKGTSAEDGRQETAESADAADRLESDEKQDRQSA